MATYPGDIHSKLPNTGTTIFTVMSGLANEVGAINLSQGFPDFESSPKLIELVNHYMKKGYNQYAPMQGILPLRERITEKMETLYSVKYHPEKEICITPGATYAIFTAITSLIKEGDEVIIFTPAYDCYAPAVEINGGMPVYIQLKPPHYTIDWGEVKKMLSRKTRMIILNTPQNPTGTILSAQDMEKLEQLVKNSNIVVLSDEVYEHILFDDYEHQSVARFPELVNRSIIVFSFGKTFHNTGWKMGYCLAPENLMAEFCKVHQFNVFTCNTPIQYALADFMANEENYLRINEMYEQKRDFFNNIVKDSRFILRPSAGTYFQLLDYSEITDEKDTEYAIRLTKEKGVASIPLSVFYNKKVDNNMLRFCFAKTEETLEKAGEVLCKI
ncbi:MAG: methionine aminotransferase [Flavobacteriales bacterium]|nr:MAG: methionine aminotransferase [Flavobacteriales bacterium]